MYRIQWTRNDQTATGFWGSPMSLKDARQAVALLKQHASQQHTYRIVKHEKSH